MSNTPNWTNNTQPQFIKIMSTKSVGETGKEVPLAITMSTESIGSLQCWTDPTSPKPIKTFYLVNNIKITENTYNYILNFLNINIATV
jgi:hypothetical protein